MKIAIQGCGHGELDEIYSHLTKVQAEQQITVDLLIICGDFQAIRNYVDQQSLSCPEKYKRLGSFHQYYAGIKRAPVLTIFIGGNHEASNYMMELYHGGWVCENIYFMGYAGVFNYGGLRIGGLSGIWKEHDYYKGALVCMPYYNTKQ
jgi:lariat debranching enzyme